MTEPPPKESPPDPHRLPPSRKLLLLAIGLAAFASVVVVAVTFVPGERLSPPAPLPGTPEIDLLALVDPARDGVKGTWTLENGRLVSDDGDASLLEIPYELPDEYTFTVEFVRRRGNDAVNQILARAGKVFVWQMGGWGNTVFGLSEIDGKGANENATTVKKERCLENGRVHTSTVEVRKDRVTIFFDNQRIVDWKTDYRELGTPDVWRLRRDRLPGIGTRGGSTEFRRIRLFEFSGRGRPLRPASK